MIPWIEHRAARRKAALTSLPHGRFTLRFARTLAEYEDAFRLVYVSYASLGIERPSREGLRMADHHSLSEAKVITAYEADRVVGTITVTFDSPAGVPLDAEVPAHLVEMRKRGYQLAEIGSLAVVQRCRRGGVSQLLSLAALRVAFGLGRASHAVIGVNPRAAAFYRGVWGFDVFGGEHDHPDLHAPVATLLISRDRLFEHSRRHYRRACPSGRTVSDHLFASDAPLPGCVIDPSQGAEELDRIRMSREIFQSLFRLQTDRLGHLQSAVRDYVGEQRSPDTVGQTFLRRMQAKVGKAGSE